MDIRVRVHKSDYVSMKWYCLVLCALRTSSKGGAGVFHHVYRFGETSRCFTDVVHEIGRLGTVPVNCNGINMSEYRRRWVTKRVRNEELRTGGCYTYLASITLSQEVLHPLKSWWRWRNRWWNTVCATLAIRVENLLPDLRCFLGCYVGLFGLIRSNDEC